MWGINQCKEIWAWQMINDREKYGTTEDKGKTTYLSPKIVGFIETHSVIVTTTKKKKEVKIGSKTFLDSPQKVKVHQNLSKRPKDAVHTDAMVSAIPSNELLRSPPGRESRPGSSPGFGSFTRTYYIYVWCTYIIVRGPPTLLTLVPRSGNYHTQSFNFN